MLLSGKNTNVRRTPLELFIDVSSMAARALWLAGHVDDRVAQFYLSSRIYLIVKPFIPRVFDGDMTM